MQKVPYLARVQGALQGFIGEGRVDMSDPMQGGLIRVEQGGVRWRVQKPTLKQNTNFVGVNLKNDFGKKGNILYNPPNKGHTWAMPFCPLSKGGTFFTKGDRTNGQNSHKRGWSTPVL